MIPTRAQFLAAAKGHVGTKVRHMGRTPWGVDCVGLAISSLAQIGVQIDAPTRYAPRPPADLLTAELMRFCNQIEISAAEPGDLAQIMFDGSPRHLAVIERFEAGHVYVIHASASMKKVIHAPIAERVVAYWRIRALES